MIQPQTLEIRNGEKIPAIFSKEEMDNRLQAIRSLMEEQKLDGILFTSFHNINYFDHILYTAFGRNYGLVVSMEPMIMIPEGMAGSGGYREHDILLVTENGAENLTGFPFGPEHNIIQK